MVIAETAKGIAAAAYEVLAGGSNEWYAANPNMKAWVAKNWQTFAPKARECLVDLLADPNTHDNLKEPIFEALCLDGAMNPPLVHSEREVGLLN